jgi:hypothetical protein
MNVFENIHLVLATACEKNEIGRGELCGYHQRLRDILAQYEGGRLPDAAYQKAELLNDEINQRFSPMMRARPKPAGAAMAGIRCLISSVGWRGPPTLYNFSPGSIPGCNGRKLCRTRRMAVRAAIEISRDRREHPCGAGVDQ